MIKLLKKILLYAFLIIISLELLVRLLHLAKDTPTRFVDEQKVEKWVPNQHGYSVTGNRRQNFSEYHINSSGFNSYREFTPTTDKVEIALVGDSFIEGFHQDYYNSIGKKIENRIPGIEVYEYGYAGYDLADQLHLISKNQEEFAKIDLIILGLNFKNDLTRPIYKVVESRLALESPKNKLIKKSKLLVYLNSIGVIPTIRGFVSKVIRGGKPSKSVSDNNKDENDHYDEHLINFKSLISTYSFNKEKSYFLIDETITPPRFLTYLDLNNFEYIKIGEPLKRSKLPVTLIYDRHWSDAGRQIVAQKISTTYSQHE